MNHSTPGLPVHYQLPTWVMSFITSNKVKDTFKKLPQIIQFLVGSIFLKGYFLENMLFLHMLYKQTCLAEGLGSLAAAEV